MKTPARYAAAAVFAALCVGPAAAAADSGKVCAPEFVVREPDTEGLGGIYDARWCGSDAIVYMTRDRYGSKVDPFMVRVDLATGERRRVATGRVTVNDMDGIDSVASSFGCVPDGSWVYYTVPNRDYGNRR